ncbi:putative metabolite transport protein CsbC [Sodalis glossinidius str. 'morsitans']|uniref:Putative metabolite transport protein CsbC n=1 Tax=Sodalis glossinidius (strain morsitans) TaxID=343509 RepID=A0A193QHG1_SODGM|nr:putative metabolite transport protein CsbC [Sodalis glossinidius str. 'morsitans']
MAIIGAVFHLGIMMQGVIVSASLLGAMAGAGVSTVSSSVAVLVAARMLLGTGVGACLVLVPVYIAELAPARIRGMLVASFQLLITLGILLAYGINTLCGNRRRLAPAVGDCRSVRCDVSLRRPVYHRIAALAYLHQSP